MPKRVYAVAVGWQPGIYFSWDEANAQVKDFPGAKFRGFNNPMSDAIYFMEQHGAGGYVDQRTRSRCESRF